MLQNTNPKIPIIAIPLPNKTLNTFNKIDKFLSFTVCPTII